MPLTLILGRVGCGKISRMADEIARSIDASGGSQKITLLVPDQYTVASEQFFLTRVGEKRFRHLNVLSLKSLARTEFAKHAMSARFLGEGGKTVLLKKAFDAVSPSLRHYPPEYRNPSFLSLILGAIKELKAAGISAEDLMETAKREQNDKLYDLAMIRQVYEEYLADGYFDPDDAPARLCKLLEETGDFEGERVYVANFRSFYNRERNILLQMVKNGAHVTVTLPTHTTDPQQAGPTADAAEEARKLVAYCRRMGEECTVVNLQKTAEFSSEEFALLESEFAASQGKIWKKVPQHVHLYGGSDRFDEAEFVAATISKKVRDEGYRYGDFTVIVRSLEDYAGVLDPVFDQYGIPLFYHRKTPLRQRNPMPLITALLSLATEGLSADAALSFVKSGLVCTPEKASWFERYIDVWSIRYNRFKTPFVRPIGGYTDTETEEEANMRQGAEQVRQTMISAVDTLVSRSQKATVREISLALYEILEELGVPAALERNAESYRDYGEYELSARQKKVYEQLLLALDEMVLTAGDDVIPLKEYRDLFFSVIDTHDIAILPTSLDEVVAGSPETLPMISPRCVFVLGLNEGVFPKNIDDNRLLTDRDREQLAPFGMGETTDDKVLHEMFYLYLALTAPREELYLSYASVIGGEAAPSWAIERVKEIFPKLPLTRFSLLEEASLSERIQRERAAFALHTKSPVEELAGYFAKNEEYKQILSHREEVSSLAPETAAALYPNHLFVSASRADKFYQCRYAYFLRYGLGISPRSRAELDHRQKGTVVHEALETIISQGLDCSDEELHQRVCDFGAAQIFKFYGDEAPPPTVQSYFDALMKKIERLLLLFRKEFAASKFVPYSFEQKVGIGDGSVKTVEIPLETGSLSMIGVVDRVDVYEEKGVKYLRVVDYKTGKKNFSFQLIQNGIDVQMLMYLYALQQNLFPGETCLPAGVQYIGAYPKTVSGKRSEDPRAVLLQWEKELPRSGVFLKDNGVLSAMDATEDRRFLQIKNDSFLLTAEEFGKLFQQISDLLQKMGNALHQGRVEKNPVKIGSLYCSCNYCDLREYCRHQEPRDVFSQGEEGGHA